ncbi:MIP/aquaporin family protein [Actinopolymorpha pittospori]|uniref:Glycerol uptake facilitator protein/aquaporin Z n=1 Tax=Actinopolymorpha pittospori TaxID=648752 RepID=A0A927MX61_9ACTN|nr:MIP/aquaporin family protein [Actinopolymorpha pittospori]MBE1608244.1 glycerol uptake facilitator protein/aquaporin Z [Actinopolymorpha pittospori]
MAERSEQPGRTPTGPNSVAPEDWATIVRHGLVEAALTLVLLFGVLTIVRWVVGPSPVSATIPQIHLQLLIIGICVGIFLALLILSRPGRLTGGHLNPAVSLAMWRFGVFPGKAVIPYIVGQLVGSVLGGIVGRAVWGPVVEELPIVYGALQPGPGWTAGELFLAEAAGMAVIVAIVGTFLQNNRLARFVPWLVGFLIGAAIVALGTTTGGSENPARQFGPAVLSGHIDFLWVYLTAPMVGATLATVVLNRLHQRQHRRVLTHRLCGTRADGSRLDD